MIVTIINQGVYNDYNNYQFHDYQNLTVNDNYYWQTIWSVGVKLFFLDKACFWYHILLKKKIILCCVCVCVCVCVRVMSKTADGCVTVIYQWVCHSLL